MGIGDSVTEVIPYFEGLALTKGCGYDGPLPQEIFSYYGGADVTNYLAELLGDKTKAMDGLL